MVWEFPKGRELQKHKVNTLKRQLEKQSNLFQKFTTHSETVTFTVISASMELVHQSHTMKRNLFKKCLSDVVAILCLENDSLKLSVMDLQLSRHTVKQKILDIKNSVETNLYSDRQKCQYFSIALD